MIFRGAQQIQEINNQLRTELEACKRAEELSRKGEEQLRAVANALPDLLFVLDEDGRYLEVLTSEETLLYANANRLLGCLMHEVLPKEKADLFLATVRKTIQTKRVQVLEYELDVQAGSLCFEGRTSPLNETIGGKGAVVWVSRDITERKQAEMAQRKLAAIVESSDDAIVSKTIDGVITTWNKGAERIYGYAAGEVVGRLIDILVPPDRADEVLAILKKISRGERVEHYETVRVRKDGTRLNASLTVSPIKDNGGRITGASVIERDITERTRGEEALRQSEERFRLIMEHANDAIFYIDLNGEILWASHRAEVMTGWSSDKLIGRPIMELLSPNAAVTAAARLDAVRRGEAVAPLVEIEFLRPDGLMIWGEANITSVLHDGDTIGRLLVVRNITERRMAGEALRKSEQQLRQLLEDRERFSQNLHDNIIQMLYAIGLGLEESQRLIGGDSKTAVKNLSRAVKDLNEVIRDVRSFIAGSEPTISSGQQLKAAIEHLARTMAGAHLLEFRLQLDPMAASRLASEEVNHVLYIVREAMSNSLRHSGAKTGVVMLQRQKGRVHLQVEDDGVGFDPADNGGTGQGLRNITARAKELGANLEIVAEPGRGVRIALDIPKESEHVSA